MGRRDADAWDQLSAAEASLAMCSFVLRRMGPGDGKAQTPCAKYDVDQLTGHLAGSLVGLGGCVGVDVTPDEDAEREVRIADLAQPVLEGWRRHGIDGMVTLGQRASSPPRWPRAILSMELLVHAWDFARATGQELPANDGLSTYVLGLAKDGLIQPAAARRGQLRRRGDGGRRRRPDGAAGGLHGPPALTSGGGVPPPAALEGQPPACAAR